MKTYSLNSIWFKTVKGTEFEQFNWDEIAEVLITQEYILPCAHVSGRYILNHSKLNCSRDEIKGVILKVLVKTLGRKGA